MLEHSIYQLAPLVEPGEEELFLRVMPHCTYTRWHPQGVDILLAGDGKAEGIRATLDYYGLKQEEIMAFGDGVNDLSMLSMAGLSVAVGNAVPEVKRDGGLCHRQRGGGRGVRRPAPFRPAGLTAKKI